MKAELQKLREDILRDVFLHDFKNFAKIRDELPLTAKKLRLALFDALDFYCDSGTRDLRGFYRVTRNGTIYRRR